MDFITVRSFDNAIGAHILKARLEGEGLQCHIFDENVMTIDPILNIAIGGIKVKVHENDVPRAKEILAEIDETPHTDEEDQVIACPNCESTDLYSDFKSMKGVKGFFSMLSSFFLMVFPIYYKSVYRCKNCQTEFKAKRLDRTKQG